MSYDRLQTIFFTGLLLGAAVLVGFLLLPYLGSLVLGITFAVVFHPVYRRLLRLVGGSESVAALLTTLLILIIIFTPLIFFGVRIFQEARQVYLAASTAADSGEGLAVSDVGGLPRRLLELPLNVSGYLRQGVSWLLQHLGAVFSSLAQLGLSLLLSLLAIYYLLKDGVRLRRAVTTLSPLLDTYDALIFSRLHAAIVSVVKGSLLIAVIQGIAAGIGLYLFGIPQAALWGGLAVVAALIPTVGTSLVMIPPIAYLLATGQVVAGSGLAVWAILVVGLVDNFLRPKLIEHGLRIHPFLILLAVLGGLSLVGPTGFLFGPLVLSLLFALLDIYPTLMAGEARTTVART